jgi:diacylglycerol O-acyltransferase
VWVNDPLFDLTLHVRRAALPAPGDDAALCRLISWITSQRLDRDRPLWDCWVIEGLSDGRWAVLTRVHHCMADGISGHEIHRVMFDESEQPRQGAADSWRPGPEPASVRLLAGAVGGLIRAPSQQARVLVAALRSPALVAQRIAGTARGLVALSRAMVPVSKSSLTGQISQQRDYARAQAVLADVVGVAKAFQVTVNDVVLAAVSGAFRTLLRERGEEPAGRAIRALVPVSMRAARDAASIGNQVSLMLPLLPIDYEDPVGRLREVHRRLTAAKASRQAEAFGAVTTLASHAPFGPFSSVIRLAGRLPHRNLVTVTTNVAGSRRPLYILGRRTIQMLPYVPIGVRMRTGIAVLTYDGRICFGVTTDLAGGPSARALAGAIGDAIVELVHATPAARLSASPLDAEPARETTTSSLIDVNVEDDALVDRPGQGDERAVLAEALHWQRATLEGKRTGPTADGDVRRSMAPVPLPLLELVRHMAEVERIWFRQRMAGQDAPPLFHLDTYPPIGSDGMVHDAEAIERAWQAWRSEVAFADGFVADAPDLDIIGNDPYRGPVSLRWVLVHMVEEYARHNGHADVLSSRSEQFGEASPR